MKELFSLLVEVIELIALIMALSCPAWADEPDVDAMFDAAANSTPAPVRMLYEGSAGEQCRINDDCPVGADCMGYIRGSHFGRCECPSKIGCVYRD